MKPGARRLNDGGGLYLLPFARGESHYWRMDYTHQSRRRTLSLGSHPQVGLDEARALAKAARAELDIGIDPMDERREQRAQHRRNADDTRRAKSGQPVIGSFEEVARRWFEVKSGQWMETYSSKVIRRLELHEFPRFGTMPISEITPKIVLDACRAVERNDTLETEVPPISRTLFYSRRSPRCQPPSRHIRRRSVNRWLSWWAQVAALPIWPESSAATPAASTHG